MQYNITVLAVSYLAGIQSQDYNEPPYYDVQQYPANDDWFTEVRGLFGLYCKIEAISFQVLVSYQHQSNQYLLKRQSGEMVISDDSKGLNGLLKKSPESEYKWHREDRYNSYYIDNNGRRFL